MRLAGEEKHTPGPWEAYDELGWRVGTKSRSYGSQGGVGRVVIAEVMSGPTEADARLIAAAPELLEALLWVTPPQGDCDKCKRTGGLCIAHAAIEKAKGGRDA